MLENGRFIRTYRITMVRRTGWVGSVFVLPHKTIGETEGENGEPPEFLEFQSDGEHPLGGAPPKRL